eukprot:979996-Prorocentrum_lima.AAC.1
MPSSGLAIASAPNPLTPLPGSPLCKPSLFLASSMGLSLGPRSPQLSGSSSTLLTSLAFASATPSGHLLPIPTSLMQKSSVPL